MSHADRVRVHNDLIEAILHLLDGSPRWLVAEKFHFSQGYLSMVMGKRKSEDTYTEARAIYSSCRREQLTRGT